MKCWAQCMYVKGLFGSYLFKHILHSFFIRYIIVEPGLRRPALRVFSKILIRICRPSVKECIALQKALDSTLFSGFEGAIRHFWSVI